MENRKFWILTAVSLAILFGAATWMASNYYIGRKVDFVAERLALLGELRRSALEEHFATSQAELRFWSTDPKLVESQARLVEKMAIYRREVGEPGPELYRMYVTENPFPEDRSKLLAADADYYYNQWHKEFHPLARRFVSERGYYDFFMVSPDGVVIYSVEKEADYSTNLLTGPWKDTALAEVFTRAMEYGREGRNEVAISDLESYAPSEGVPALFMAKAVHGKEGKLLGVVAFQLPVEEIHEIMNFTAGMRQTGETYLVGEDLLMRSDSRFSEESTTLKLAVDTETVHLALAGEVGVQFGPDYRGVEVLSAYTQARIDDNRWAVMAEMDREEILEIAASERPMLGGLILFFYGLSLWSAWFLRNDSPGEEGQGMAIADLFDTDLSDG